MTKYRATGAIVRELPAIIKALDHMHSHTSERNRLYWKALTPRLSYQVCCFTIAAHGKTRCGVFRRNRSDENGPPQGRLEHRLGERSRRKKWEMYRDNFNDGACEFVLDDVHTIDGKDIPDIELATASRAGAR